MLSPLFHRVLKTPTRNTQRLWRWVIVATGPLLLVAMLLISMQDWRVAQAAGGLVTQTLTVSTTNVAIWTAEIGVPISEQDAEAINLSIPVTAQAVVTISSNTLDQDDDGIPDNVEGTVDANSNGIPDFLDPTAEPPREQPGKPKAGKLFLPSLGNN